MAGAAFHTGESKQDYCTPRAFLDAVEQRFGPIVWDLAASNTTSAIGTRLPANYFGPDHTLEGRRDALAADWTRIGYEPDFGSLPQMLWLNPPYAKIGPWAQKCAMASISLVNPVEILFLVPASVGSNWFWDFVAPYADVYCLAPRLSFDGKHPFPKDLILAHYRPDAGNSFSRWKWK